MKIMPSPIVNAIVEIQLNGRATRGNLEAGRLLTLCQRCERYADCAIDDLVPKGD